MSSFQTASTRMSSGQWSTATLEDGIKHVKTEMAEQEVEESESDLERQLQDCSMFMVYMYI